MLRTDGQQLADGILDGTDVTAGINYLRLHAQVRSLHLVDGSAIGLAVLPEGLLGLERLVPQAIGLQEDFQLAVKHLQHQILLGSNGDEVGARGLLIHLSLQQHGLGGTLLVGDGTEHVNVHRQLQRQVVSLGGCTLVKTGEGALRRKDQRGQVGHLGSG